MPGRSGDPRRRASSSSSCPAGCRSPLGLRPCPPSRPRRAVAAHGPRRRSWPTFARSVRELARETRRRAARRRPSAQLVVSRWSESSKPGSAPRPATSPADRRAGVQVRRRADALPVGDGAAGGRSAPSNPVELRRRAALVAWSSPVMTTAAFSPRGRYQKRGIGRASSDICVIRFASRRCCSSACGIRMFAKSTQLGKNRSLERSAGRPPSRSIARPAPGCPGASRPRSAARSYANAAAWPPAVPTSRSVTAGAPVCRLALSWSVATVRAPPPTSGPRCRGTASARR